MARRAARNAAASAAQIAVQTAGNLAATALAARALGPDHMGVFGLLAFAQGVFGVIAAGGWSAAAIRFVAQQSHDPEQAGAAFRQAAGQALRNAIFLCAGVLAIAGGIQLLAQAGRPVPLTALQAAVLAVGLVPTALSAVLTGTHQALGRFDRVMAAGCVSALLLVGGTAAILHAGHSVTALLALNALVWGIQAALLAWPLRSWLLIRSRGPTIEQGAMRPYARACLVMNLLDSVVWQRSEVFFLGLWAGHAAIAQYVLAYGLASTAMKVVPGSLVPLLVPTMATAVDREALSRTFLQASRAMAILAVPAAVGLGLVAPVLIRLLYGPAYAPASGLMVALTAANALVMVFGYPASSVLYATDGERSIAIVGVAVAVLNLTLDVTLIGPLGAWGAVLANCLAQLASLGPGLYLARKRILGRFEPWHVVKPMMASAAMALPVLLLMRLAAPWSLLLGVPAGAFFYGVALIAVGGLSRSETRALLTPERRPGSG